MYSQLQNFSDNEHSDNENIEEKQGEEDLNGNSRWSNAFAQGGHGRTQEKYQGQDDGIKNEQVLDFEELDGIAGSDQRELFIYALPLFWDPKVAPENSLVFLPVPRFKEEVDRSGFRGRLMSRIDELQNHASDAWNNLKEREPGTFGNKVFQVGQHVVNMSVEERLTKSIPENISKVVIFHPTQIGPDLIMERISSMTTQHSVASSCKAAAASIMLPIAFGIDTVIIPGPAFFTYLTAYQLYKNAASVMGSARLTKYIAQDGSSKEVRINYAGDPRLDRFYEMVQTSMHGVLAEQDIEDMANAINEQGLMDALYELRVRRLREMPKKDDYALLPEHND